MASEKASLLSLWEERRILYEQCMDLQLFYRDTDQAETWMTKQEVSRFVLLGVTQRHDSILRLYTVAVTVSRGLVRN